MAKSTWSFKLNEPNRSETRELIDLPTDFFLKVTFRHNMPEGIPFPKVKMVLERSSDPKNETHDLWEGDPPYYGYAKKVTVTVQKDPADQPPHNPVTGIFEIEFQTAPF